MAYNEKSLANLKKGNATSYKKTLTKPVQMQMVEWLIDNQDRFEEYMATLDPKDWVAAYLKMMSVLLPKQTLLDVAHQDGPAPEFVIHFGQPIN